MQQIVKGVSQENVNIDMTLIIQKLLHAQWIILFEIIHLLRSQNIPKK